MPHIAVAAGKFNRFQPAILKFVAHLTVVTCHYFTDDAEREQKDFF